MKLINYSIILKEEPEGGHTVIVPSLPGCVTYGKNIEEAKKMALDAIRAYVSSLKKHKETVPSDNSVLLTSVTLEEKQSRLSYA